jgi:hypothetical protein
MKNQRIVRNTRCGAGGKRLLAVQIAALGLLLVAAQPVSAQDNKDSGAMGSGNSIGFIASKDASAKEVGLPLYPGARPHREKSDDSPAAQLGLWGGAWGFKLAVLKLESNDPPEKIATFYHKALAKYGKVLNCADATKAVGTQEKTDSVLTCKDDHPENGETVLKAGTKEKQHIVAIKLEGGLSVVQLVYVEARGSDSNN